jgi:Type I restriction-modification system methyltransferase subunit
MKAITYYQDPHELFQKADYVMANPPFNVDEVDADKVKNDPRLPFGLPGVNNQNKVSNGNYLWISYFYSYLNEKGRAGFVMSSQASSAGRDEAKVRQKLVETGAVEIMVSIRSNFFYTRTVPCELWFLNKAKPEEMKDFVLMIDARNIFRKVTRKIYDFSPEQEQNILAIVWLYRGEAERYLELVSRYCETMLREAKSSINSGDENLLNQFCQKMTLFLDNARPYIIRLSGDHTAKRDLLRA